MVADSEEDVPLRGRLAVIVPRISNAIFAPSFLEAWLS